MEENKTIEIKQVLDYWFNEEMKQYWFASTPEIDAQISDKYKALWKYAKLDGLDHWRQSAEGCLALCIVLDQMPLNMFRDHKRSFSTEQQATKISKYAIEKKFDKKIDKDRVAFLYMPLMHSENILDQDLSVESFQKAGLDHNMRFAKHHRELIREFGRFPHRNKILGRDSTQKEIEYLKSKQAFTG